MKSKSFSPAKQLERDAPASRKITPRAPASRFLSSQTFPTPLTVLIGREHELALLKRRFKNTRLLTLTGAGGSGKTRLALEVATRHAAQFRDGVWWVELAPLADAALVPNAVAAALGVREKIGQSFTDVLVSFLQPRALLLVLDNCEHLIGACAQLVHTLLSACGELKILATSREPLGIAGESVYLVPALEMPGETWAPSLAAVGRKHYASALSRWYKFDAVRLFVERGRETDSKFALTAQNVNSIAQICRRLDGMPLAIELAAARVRTLSPDEIAARLDDRFRLLTSAGRTVSPRHQTLQAAMDWSYALLSEAERALLRRLAVFAGGWTLDAAIHVTNLSAPAGAAHETETLNTLSHLIDKSLIVKQERNGDTRYDMLETIRQYARARLGEADENDAVSARHLDYFVALAEEAESKLQGREELEWLRRLQLELENVRAALAWALEKGAIEKGLRLATALVGFWYHTGYLAEGSAWLEHFLIASPDDVSAARAQGMIAAGRLARPRGDLRGAVKWLNAGLKLYRALEEFYQARYPEAYQDAAALNRWRAVEEQYRSLYPQLFADAAAQERWRALEQRYRAVYGIPALAQ